MGGWSLDPVKALDHHDVRACTRRVPYTSFRLVVGPHAHHRGEVVGMEAELHPTLEHLCTIQHPARCPCRPQNSGGSLPLFDLFHDEVNVYARGRGSELNAISGDLLDDRAARR